METTILIEGMHCDGCADRVRRVLEREPGVRRAEVSLEAGRARVEHGDDASLEGIVRAVQRAGYGGRVLDEAS